MSRRWWSLAAGAALLTVGAGRATTIQVNSLADSVVSGDGFCTLREAIVAANTNTASGGALGECPAGQPAPVQDAIIFAVAGAIQPASPLPTVTEPLMLNGFGAPGDPGTPCPSFLPVPAIELVGTNAGGPALQISAGGSTVRGLTINRFPNNAILLTVNGGNRVQCCRIGTDPAGTLDLGNWAGVAIASDGNLIGADGDGANDDREGNLISGSSQWGVIIAGDVHLNRVSGNRIGTNANGTAPLANASYGVWINEASNNVVGTNGDGVGDAFEGNLISGNNFAGIYLENPDAQANRMSGNRIGTNALGTAAIPNGEYGIEISTGGNIVGTNGDGNSDALEGNLISGNSVYGVFLYGLDAQQNRIAGNRIGTDAAGTAAIPNILGGVFITQEANHNFIGTNGDGVADAAEGNLISGNGFDGVRLVGSESAIVWPPFDNRVSGNRIGTTAGGLAALPNQRAGVFIGAGDLRSVVGANGDGIADEAEGNVIAFNDSNGITVVDGHWGSTVIATRRARVSGNSIFSNGALGLDLGGDGVTANDAGDADAGANELQNFPEIDSATAGAGALQIVYSVPSPTPPPLEIEFFRADADGEEGEIFLGGATFLGGVATVNLPAGPTTPGSLVVATATDVNGNTSEFSLAVTVLDGSASFVFIDGFESGDTLLWSFCAGCL